MAALMESPMSILSVWSHLQSVLDQGADPNQPQPYRKRFSAYLQTLDARSVARIYREIHDLRVGLRQRRLWCAVSLLLGHYCGDEEFMDFCGWLIAHGEQVYAQVLENPDSLVELEIASNRQGQPQPGLKAVNATPGKVYLKLVGDDDELDAAIRAEFESADAMHAGDDDSHIGWLFWELPTAAELSVDLPRLWARYGANWTALPLADDPEHPFAGFIKQAQIAGLGLVQVGDELVQRHDGSRFTVLGLSDLHSMYVDGAAEIDADADAESDAASEPDANALRYIARIREADGSVRSNQGLSRRNQRWPHEAAEGELQGDPAGYSPWSDEFDADEEDAEGVDLQAWEQADQVIQDRIAAAIDGEVRVIYAAYDEDADQLPVDNLDEVAYRGQIRFVETDPLDGERYESEVLSDPTWLQLALAANQMMVTLGYEDHVYLEGFEVIRRPKGKPRIGEFVLGS
jgi:hypothetical protein